MKFRESPCNYCGESEYQVIVRGRDLLLDLPGDFQFVKCVNCGLLRQNPFPEWSDLKDSYPENYAAYQPQADEIQSNIKRWDKRFGLWKRVNIVKKYQPCGEWIDIGAGTGRILREALSWGKWDLTALEPIEHAAEHIKRSNRITVLNVQLEELDGKLGQFDIVTMWDVLEHLNQPVMSLQKIYGLLKSGGIFIFSTPNLGSWDRKIFRKFWVGYDLPRHMYLFPDKLLTKILTKMGFEVIGKKCVAGSHGALMLDLKFYNRKANSKILSKILSKGPDFIIPRLITFIPLWFLDKLKLGPNITYIAKKS